MRNSFKILNYEIVKMAKALCFSFFVGLPVNPAAAGGTGIKKKEKYNAEPCFRNSKFKKKWLLFFVVALCGIVIAAEFSIRTLDYSRGHSFWSNAHRNLVTKAMKPLIPYRIFGWPLYQEIDGEQYIVSVHGERYPLKKRENTFRVVAFGEGNTEKVIDGVHYPLLLRQMLQKKYPQKQIEVINVGESKYATTHSITLLAFDVISWDPNLVIMDHNGNDLLNAYWSNPTYDYSNKYGTSYYLPDYKARLTKANILFDWSSLYWFLKERISLLQSDNDLRQKRTMRRIAYGDKPPKPAENIFSRNLHTFAAIAKSNEIPVILGTQPLNPVGEEWEKHFRLKDYNEIVRYPLPQEFFSHHKTFNDTIEKVARATNSFFVDQNEIFNGNPEYFTDYVHVSKSGLELLARNYFNLIAANNLIQQ